MTRPVSEGRPTIVDVARKAGLSVGTVSNYLNGQSLRMANRTRIEAAIEELSFTRNQIAVSMKTTETRLVGLLVPSMSEFHGGIAERLSGTLHGQGRALLTYCHGQKPDVMDQALDFFVGQRVAALVLSGADCLRDKLVRLADRGLPIICFNNDIEGVPMQRVFVNNRDAVRRAIGHLIDLGHSQIAVLSGDLGQSTARERLEGYHQAMADHALAADERLIAAGSWRPSLAYAALSDLLDGPQKPTALFSSSAGMTFGALQLLADRGLRIPEDISLIGFDDSIAFRLRERPLTVIQQPLDRIAGAIGELLAAHLESNEYLAPGTLRFDCDLIIRRSCGRRLA